MGVIVDRNAAEEIFNTLEKLNINYYKSAELDFLYKPVCTHPDMQIHFITENCAVAAPSVFAYYKKVLPECIQLYKGAKDPGSTYPYDCAYNVAKMGKRVIGNHLYTDQVIKKLYQDIGCEFVNVKQGYTKCNMCIVDENTAITEDVGIYNVLKQYKIDVLKVPVGEISLEFFKHGFIGGASGKIMPEKLCFCGDISKLSYFDKINDFLSKKSIDIMCLSQTKPADFGSILYLNDNPT